MTVDTSSISAAGLSLPSTTGKTTPSTAKSAKSDGSLDKDAFLKLLAAQASNQDPMNPTDSTAQIAQLAQFSSLEQMNNMATTMTKMNASVNTQKATALVGHSVTYKGADGTDVTGTVTSVKMATDGALLTIGGVEGIDPATLIEVR